MATGTFFFFMTSTLSLFTQAAGSGSAPGRILGSSTLMIILMGVMMFVMMRSQSKKQREIENLQKALKVGDEVITAGGIHGTITSLKDKTLNLRIAEGVKIEVDRQAVVTVKNKSNVVDAA
jgi:preprotein translocase subunit YajC